MRDNNLYKIANILKAEPSAFGLRSSERGCFGDRVILHEQSIWAPFWGR